MPRTERVPREKTIDDTFKVLTEGYMYIPNRRARLRSNIFITRLLGQKVICIGGEEAAQLFYDTEKFQRKGAVPNRIQESLFGKKAVQALDGVKHQHRKQLFMSLMTKERLQLLTKITEKQWQQATKKWHKRKKITLFDEAREIMVRTACEWAGVPLQEEEVSERANDLGDMIDAFGAVGPRHWAGRQARNRSERWIQSIIEKVRSEKLDPSPNSALYAMAWHRDLNNKLLDSQIAAVELINIIRPIVAIARYVTFGAIALHDYPETREKLQADDGNYSQWFVQEVRRFYPFGPFLGARVKRDFIWQDCRFKKGTLVLLDIYGTNHDPKLWENPNEFHPERFKEWEGSPFDFIPQGGGDYHKGHRCAGEWVTIEVMKTSLEFLAQKLDYQVPAQDLHIGTVRMPPLPESGFVLKNVHARLD
ncbi:cytochrome P450 [Virgibacillus dakarensis]|uniref:cytochrome P450 n=1 Tax=Virgibacillus dakarensis TaxID=1917889 RepID=UPI000B446780|nr:cytochrome P450 [Virgibacillus dakarensis]MBT2215766.1 cytochrome P450 [Virgibacillus dakarensis]